MGDLRLGGLDLLVHHRGGTPCQTAPIALWQPHLGRSWQLFALPSPTMLIASNLRRSNRHGPNRTAAQRCATGTAARKKSSHPILQTGNPVVGQQRQAFQQFCCASGRVKRAGPSCPDTSRLTSTSLRLKRIVSSRALAPPDRERRSNPLRSNGASRRRTRSPDSCPLSTAPGLDDRAGRPSASDPRQPIVLVQPAAALHPVCTAFVC